MFWYTDLEHCLVELQYVFRLIQAMNIIDEFNVEEASFGLEISQYPLRKQIHDRLVPYKKLYDNASEFLAKHDLWMNSTIGSHNPEDIDVDITTFYRNIYKLEKYFCEFPAPKGLATTVSNYL